MDGYWGGLPERFDFDNVSVFRLTQALIESYSVVCVSCFILITGYFGLNIKAKKIWDIIVLLLTLKILYALIESYLTNSSIVLWRQFLVISNSGYFVIDYLLLTFFSPMINAFIAKFDRKYLLIYFISFWCIEIYFGFIRDIYDFGFNQGYSLIHFVLLYILGRLIALYQNQVMKLGIKYSFAGYLILGFLVFAQYFLLGNKCFWYSNPLVVLEALFLFLPFLHFNFYVKWINWIASSMLAVYVLHTKAHVWLSDIDLWLLKNYSYGNYLLIMIFIINGVFILSICIDKFRKLVFGTFSDIIFNFIYKNIISYVRKTID